MIRLVKARLSSFLLVAATVLSQTLLATPKDRLVYMAESEGSAHVYLAGEGKGTPKRLTQGKALHIYPDIDDSGRFVALIHLIPGEIAAEKTRSRLLVFDRVREQWQEYDSSTGYLFHPEFSGNGNKLAYVEQKEGILSAEIKVVDFAKAKTLKPEEGEKYEGQNVEKFSPEVVTIKSEGGAHFPALTTSGKEMVFQEAPAKDKRRIVWMNIESGDRKVLTKETEYTMSPAMHFDNQTIAYTKRNGEGWDTVVHNLKTEKSVSFGDGKTKVQAPAFRRNGDLVVSWAKEDGSRALYSISAKDIEGENFAPAEFLASNAKEVTLYSPAFSRRGALDRSIGVKMPEPGRSSFGAAKIGDNIYIVAGHNGPEHVYNKDTIIARVDVFNQKTKEWKQLPDRPVISQGFDLVAYGKYLYAFGGFTINDKNDPNWESLDTIDRFDTETNEWKTLDVRLPRARSSNAAVRLGDKVYLIAGWDAAPPKPGSRAGTFLKEVDIFDLKNETVSTADYTLPDPLRRAVTGVAFGEEILILGGISSGRGFQFLKNVSALNPKTGKWRELAKIPYGTFAPAAGVIGTDLFLFGGMSDDFEWRDQIEVFDGYTGTWSQAQNTLSETKGFSQVIETKDGKLLVLGGHAYQEETTLPVRTVEWFRLK